MAPVSRYTRPSFAATCRATVDLPAPAGPSIAIIAWRSRKMVLSIKRVEPRRAAIASIPSS